MRSVVSNEEMLSLSQAAKLLPGRPHAASLWRWSRLGVTTHSGQRVRLRVGRLGRRLFTKIEWLEEFARQCAELDAERWNDEPRSESPEHRKAMTELEERGVI